MERRPSLAWEVGSKTGCRMGTKRERNARGVKWKGENSRRRCTGKQKGDQKIEDMLGSVEWLLPNIWKVLREERSRAP